VAVAVAAAASLAAWYRTLEWWVRSNIRFLAEAAEVVAAEVVACNIQNLRNRRMQREVSIWLPARYPTEPELPTAFAQSQSTHLCLKQTFPVVVLNY
jgi:hypothetical protein